MGALDARKALDARHGAGEARPPLAAIWAAVDLAKDVAIEQVRVEVAARGSLEAQRRGEAGD